MHLGMDLCVCCVSQCSHRLRLTSASFWVTCRVYS